MKHCAEAVLENSRFQGFCSKTRTQQEKVRNWSFDSRFKNSVYNLHGKKKLMSP